MNDNQIYEDIITDIERYYQTYEFKHDFCFNMPDRISAIKKNTTSPRYQLAEILLVITVILLNDINNRFIFVPAHLESKYTLIDSVIEKICELAPDDFIMEMKMKGII